MALSRRGSGLDERASLDQLNNIQQATNVVAGNTYVKNLDAGLDGVESPIRVVGTESLFNPFNVFRYSKFAKATPGPNGGTGNVGTNDLDPYKLKYEETTRIIGDDARQAAAALREKVRNHNPSASAICNWANDQAKDSANAAGPLYPYPYAITDFLWCKYYGKIPNNRLITLRRYPTPVEDNLMVSRKNLPLVPIAQAVTWFGEDTGNKLSEVLDLSWGLKWKSITAEVQDVQGNEIPIEKILDAAGLKDVNSAARQALIIALGEAQNAGMAASGMDANLQEYEKDAYSDKGPYWNRVLGPINVIDTTMIRDKGLSFGSEKGISLTFEYNLRTWAGANPKMAFLDLMTNFLSLTYNTAPFWGGSSRYFQQTGFLAPGFNTDNLEKGNNIEGMREVAAAVGSQLMGSASDLKKWIDDLGTKIAGGSSVEDAAKSIYESVKGSKAGEIIAGFRMSSIIQKPLVMRSLLDGRAVGEWHMMIGNPMEPIAVIGNMVLDTASMELGEELGEDGFPTTVKFVVTLKHGRPRAKQDIESMFNLGGGPLAHTPLAAPSSTLNTLGESNTLRANSYYGTDIYEGQIPKNSNSDADSTATTKAKFSPSTLAENISSDQASTNLAKFFEPAVSRAYGVNFGNSPILPSYFYNRVTKD